MPASPTQINAVCNELIAEAEAIVKYTGDLEAIKDGDPKLSRPLRTSAWMSWSTSRTSPWL